MIMQSAFSDKNHKKTKRKGEKTMANQIRIAPETMRERAKAYRAEADIVGGVIKKMDSLLSQLMGEFEGDASQAFNDRYKELRPGFVKAEELVREIATSLDATAKVYEETDGKIAGLMRG